MDIITHILAALFGAAVAFMALRRHYDRRNSLSNEGPNVGIMTDGGPGNPPPPPGGTGS